MTLASKDGQVLPTVDSLQLHLTFQLLCHDNEPSQPGYPVPGASTQRMAPAHQHPQLPIWLPALAQFARAASLRFHAQFFYNSTGDDNLIFFLLNTNTNTGLPVPCLSTEPSLSLSLSCYHFLFVSSDSSSCTDDGLLYIRGSSHFFRF